MSIHMIDCTNTIVGEVKSGISQKEVGKSYGLALRSAAAGVDAPDWAAINAAILWRWKMSGLERIKAIAWKMMEVRHG